MRFNHWVAVLTVSFLTTSIIARSQSAIPSPKEYFGFNIGDNYMLASYTQAEAYIKKLAAASDRARYTVIGKTEEGRDQFMLIVSSPENLKRLDQYKSISQQLAHADGLTDEQAHTLAARGKAVVWIDGGLHATEVVATQELIEIIYQVLSRNDPETLDILDKVIILFTHANPDGMELVSNWYMRNPVPESRSLEQVPRLYEKYAGHDNNRDFYMLNLKETQNMCRQLFVEWIPQIMYNHHQAGPAGSILAGPPYRDPFNYVFDPLVITSIDAVGAAMNNRLNQENKPGYTQRAGSTYSTWYNGGLRTTTYFHNMIGLLTEIIGGPNPSEVPLVPNRLIPNGATPNPIAPQKWLFRQSIDYSISLNYAVLDYARRYHDELLFNIYRMGRNSIQRGSEDYWTLSPKRIDAIDTLAAHAAAPTSRRGNAAAANAGSATATTPDSIRNSRRAAPADFTARGPGIVPTRFYDSILKNPALRDARGYIIPADQPDFPTAVRFINALIGDGIAVDKATASFTVKGKTYPAGSYVVKTAQAFRPHVIDLFEPQDHPNDFAYPGGPPIPPYDAAGWTLAYTMGIKFDRITDAFDGPFQRIPYGELQSAATPQAHDGWLDARCNESYETVNDLLKAGKPVYRSTRNGNFYVASGHKPSGVEPVHPARIAICDIYGGSIPSGWMRFIMEQYHFPATVIYPAAIDSGGLHSKYDVIVFVTGLIPVPGEENRGGFGGGFNRNQPKPDSIPAEYRSHLGYITAGKTIPQLKQFLESGGHIVTIGSSTCLAYYLNVPVHDALVEMVNGKERKLPNEKFYIPGSVLRLNLDTAGQPAWGMDSVADVYFDQSPVFHLNPEAIATGAVRPIAWFSSDKPLRSGWAWGQSYLQNGIAAFVAGVGQGKLYAFGPEITFRAQTHGTFRLLFNQLYK